MKKKFITIGVVLAVFSFVILNVFPASYTVKAETFEDPIPLKKIPPPYPPRALAEKISGTVLVDVQVNPEGKVIEAEAITGHEVLRHIARVAAKSWSFKPLDKAAGNVIVRLTFIFHERSYVEPVKKPDFSSPYQLEILTPKEYF